MTDAPRKSTDATNSATSASIGHGTTAFRIGYSAGEGRTEAEAGIEFVEVIEADRIEMRRALFTNGHSEETAAIIVDGLDGHDAALQMLARHRLAQRDAIEFLERDRMQIAAERNEALETIRTLKAQLAAAQSSSTADKAFDAACAQVRALLRPADVDRLLERHPRSLTGSEQAEIALWQQVMKGRAIRFVAELATMTDVESDFLDGHEVRELARLLQLSDDDGRVAPTVPRLYSEEDRDRAAHALATSSDVATASMTRIAAGLAVDAVAEALGMRRAGA